MKKILVPLLIILPVLLYMKYRKNSSETGLDERDLKKRETKPQASGSLKKPGVKKREKVQANKPAAESTARCKAVTGSGKRCSRESLPDSEFCWQHS